MSSARLYFSRRFLLCLTLSLSHVFHYLPAWVRIFSQVTQQTLKKYQEYLGYGRVVGGQVAVGQIEAGGNIRTDVGRGRGRGPTYKTWR